MCVRERERERVVGGVGNVGGGAGCFVTRYR